MLPNAKNFCGGNFQDWLEVNLTDECNGKCSWCVEKNGYHPTKHVDWLTLTDAAIATNRKNIILLGGEPTLYPKLSKIIRRLAMHHRLVWMTTNGSLLSPDFIKSNLTYLHGINISVHHYIPDRNTHITGVSIKSIGQTIQALQALNIKIRLNCNCIMGYINSEIEIKNYLRFAKSLGVSSVRFAELKLDNNNFVDLAKILNYQYGLNDDPFIHGCNVDTVIDDINVNFRQMCGLQTKLRIKPENPEQFIKKVLYYDGVLYDGWQTQQIKERHVNNKFEFISDGTTHKEKKQKKYSASEEDLNKLVEDIAKGEITTRQAKNILQEIIKKEKSKSISMSESSSQSSGGCQY